MLCFDIETGSFTESFRNARSSDAGTGIRGVQPEWHFGPA
jgi:hypothetical protein